MSKQNVQNMILWPNEKLLNILFARLSDPYRARVAACEFANLVRLKEKAEQHEAI